MRKHEMINFERLMNENLGDMAHSVELDHEVQLARSELYKLAKYAIKLHNILKDADPEQGLESWVQADITKAAESISKVFHSLEYELKVSSNTQDLGSIHGSGNTQGNLPFESAAKKSRRIYSESLNRRLKKKILAEAKPGDIRTFKNKDGSISKSKAVKRFGRITWQRFYDEETGPDPMKVMLAQEIVKMAEKDPSIMDKIQNPSEVKKLANQAKKEVAKQEQIPSADLPRIDSDAAKDIQAQVVNAQKGGAPMPANQNPTATQGGGANTAQAMATTADGPGQSAGNKQMQQTAQAGDRAQGFKPSNTQAPAQPAPAQPAPDKGFQPTHFHKGNFGNTIPLQHKNGEWFWQEDGVVKPWQGDVNDRSWMGSGSVDGEIVNGKEVPYGDDETFADKQSAKTAEPAAPEEPGKVDPKLAAAAADPKNASYTSANLPGPEQPGKVDHGFQQALNKAGLKPAAQQNVAQAPATELPAVNKGGQQPAPQTVSAQGKAQNYHKANPNLPIDNPLNPYSPNFDINSLSPADQQKWKTKMATPAFKAKQLQKQGGVTKKAPVYGPQPAPPNNQANYFQQQRSGGAAPAAKPAAKPAAQQANFAQGGGGAAPAAKRATKSAAQRQGNFAQGGGGYKK